MFEISKFNSTSPRARTYELIRAFSGKRELGSRYQKTPPRAFSGKLFFQATWTCFTASKDPPIFFRPKKKGQCARDEEEGRWHFRAQGPFAGVGIAVDLRGVNQTWEGPKPMFADKLLKIHFALDSFDVYKIDTLLHRSKLKKEQLFVV